MTARDLSAVFPPSPTSVPAGLTAPSKAYKRHAWLAMGGLLAFVGLYLGLTGYLAWSVWRLLGNALLHGGNVVGAALLSLPALFFLAFLLRGLFVVKHSADPTLVEITPQDQPTLFAFLYKLADETGAPRPHKVFLSGRVNAGVFYDLSFWNLVFPSRKNLELGLGLVNTLTLDELKAVLAHEYGHFAQRTMAVGRWVYISQQIAGHIVMSRSIFDRFLSGVSRIDIRVAWIGWILRLFVWAIRAVLDTAFRLVVLAHRALGREMEFNADRVAVSVSGSDSLVHALHRLGPADEAWEEAVSFTSDEVFQGRSPPDLFALQTCALGHLRHIFDEPEFGATPKRPPNDATFRVFTAGLAQPPRMWLTHPPNREREDSAKELYVPSPLDGRSAWELFANPEQVRLRVTSQMFVKVLEERAKNPNAKPSPPMTASFEERFAERFSRAALDPRYRGLYLGRSLALNEAKASGLIGRVELLDRPGVLSALERLYPSTLRSELKTYRERREEELQLQGLADGVLTAPGGVIRYRGREIRRKELRGVIEAVKTERRDVEKRIYDHDKACRAAHLAAANLVGNGWNDALEGLVNLVHYLSHTMRNLSDAHSHLHHVLDIVLADGNVSSAERQRVLTSAYDLYQVLTEVWSTKQQLVLPTDVAAIFAEAGGWSALSDDLGLNAPNEQNLGDWLRIVDGWVSGALGDLRVLADITLDRLLETEALVAERVRDGAELEAAPTAAVVPMKYSTLLAGQERERQKKLGWWDRFQTADGVVPGTLRAVVASGLLFPALFLGGHVGSSTVHTVNGLNVPVIVTMEGKKYQVSPRSTTKWDLDPSGDVQVRTTTLDGRLIEEFEVAVGGGFSHSLYDVAHSTALVEWTAYYGPGAGGDSADRPVGAPRFTDAPQHYVFVEPPRSISLKRGESAYKRVLEAALDATAGQQLRLVTDPEERKALIGAHVDFDTVDEHFAGWAAAANGDLEVKQRLLARAAREPDNVFLQRFLLDAAKGPEKQAQCDQLRAASAAAPDDGDLVYLVLRCGELPPTPDDFLAAWKKHPRSAWLNWAVAGDLAARNDLTGALAAFQLATTTPSFAPLKDNAQVEYLRTAKATIAAKQAARLPTELTRTPEGSAVAFLISLEGAPGAKDRPSLRAWRELNHGQLARAEAAAADSSISKETRELLTLFVGGSDGAAADQMDDALAADVDGDDTWVKDALLAKRGEKIDMVRIAGLTDDERRAVATALVDPTLLKHPASLESLATSRPLRERGTIFAAAVIALGNKAPVSWRVQAKVLLFPVERPYFE